MRFNLQSFQNSISSEIESIQRKLDENKEFFEVDMEKTYEAIELLGMREALMKVSTWLKRDIYDK